MLKLKRQYFGHLMWRTDSFEKALMLGKTEGRRRKERQRMRWLDGITDSIDVEFEQTPGDNEGRKPGVLQSMGSQSIRHDLLTEQFSLRTSNCASAPVWLFGPWGWVWRCVSRAVAPCARAWGVLCPVSIPSAQSCHQCRDRGQVNNIQTTWSCKDLRRWVWNQQGCSHNLFPGLESLAHPPSSPAKSLPPQGPQLSQHPPQGSVNPSHHSPTQGLPMPRGRSDAPGLASDPGWNHPRSRYWVSPFHRGGTSSGWAILEEATLWEFQPSRREVSESQVRSPDALLPDPA